MKLRLTFPLRGRGTAKRWMRCIQSTDCCANIIRCAIFRLAAATSSVGLRRQLKVNCPEGAREATLGCLLIGEA